MNFNVAKSKKLTDAENFFLSFINEHTAFFVASSINDIAKRSGVSLATISRFARKLDFDNFRDLQMAVYKRYAAVLHSQDLNDGTQIDATINNVEVYLSYGLECTISNLDYEAIEHLAKYIFECRRLIIYGAGNSQTAGRELALNLQKLGKFVITNQDFHQILTTVATLNQQDLIFIISKNLQTRECIFLSQIANSLKVPLAIMSNNETIAKSFHPQFFLKTITLEQKKRFTALSSKIAQLALVEILLKQYITYDADHERSIKTTSQILQMWNKFKNQTS